MRIVTGKLFREMRVLAGLTQQELATLLGVHSGSISDWGKSKSKIPHAITQNLKIYLLVNNMVDIRLPSDG